MHSSNGATSLSRHACHSLQRRKHENGGGSGPATNPDIYVGVEKPDEPGESDFRRTIALFTLIAGRMRSEFPWPDGGGHENRSISAGYTYLAQLASHDLFLGDESAPSIRHPERRENLRVSPLMLETVYGRRPELDAYTFELGPVPDPILRRGWPRTRFRLDGVAAELDDGSRDTSRCPRRDIGRLREIRHGREVGCPLIADARNDDHAVLSQLTALFQLAHNAAMDVIEWNDQPSDPLDSANNFSAARTAITFAYRNIVRRDLLARLIAPEIRAYYEGSDDPDRFILDPAKGSVLTPEFLDAAYRIGHAMVRESYDFSHTAVHALSEILRATSLRAPRRTPLRDDWIIEWSRFFQMPDRPEPRFSRRIAPKYDAALHDPDLFLASDRPEPGGLPYRDLVRSAISGVMKIDALARRISERAPELASESAWISEPAHRQAAMKRWISPDRPAEKGSLEEAFVLNPPPMTYFLIEAAEAAKGHHLGPMASIVLGETFYRALEDEQALRALSEAEPEEVASEVFNKAIPATMSELIAWVDRHMSVNDKVFGSRSLPLI